MQCELALNTLSDSKPLSEGERDIIRLLATVHDSLNQDDAAAYGQQLRLLVSFGGKINADSDRAFWGFAIFLAHAVLKLSSAGVLNVQIETKEQIPPSEEHLDQLRAMFDAAVAFDLEHAQGLLGRLAGLIAVIRGIPELDLNLGASEEELKDRCVEKFANLPIEAERHYGMACFWAILCEREEASAESYFEEMLGYLKVAISSSRIFAGRARVDPDFYHLRDRPKFRSAVGLPLLRRSRQEKRDELTPGLSLVAS